MFKVIIFFSEQVLDIISKGGVKGIAHITGGGFTDNIPRVFPEGLGAVIYDNSWEVPAVFKWLQEVNALYMESLVMILVSITIAIICIFTFCIEDLIM